MHMPRPLRTLVAALAAACGLAVPALAAVHEPPVAPHSIIVFPERDFISADGFVPGQAYTVQVIRNNVTIGTAHYTATPTGAQPAPNNGLIEINHPGGGCWEVTTPDIIPGDKVRIVDATTDADQTTTANVVVTQPATKGGGSDVIVKGIAQDANGNPIPVGQLSQRIISKDLVTLLGKRRLDAPGFGTLAYDAPGSTHWTATYTNLDAIKPGLANAAVAGETRILWLGTSPVPLVESTIYEVGFIGGPAPPCTAPAAKNAVTSFDRGAVNLDNLAAPLTVSGVAQSNATEVSVTLRSGAAMTTPVVVPLPVAATQQTWSATFTPAQVQALGDGTITAAGFYTITGVPLPGTPKQLLKDTVAPPAPTATPGAGTYPTAQAVSLSQMDPTPGTTIHFTVNGTPPNEVSPTFTAPIPVTASQTINAISVDVAGNRSTLATFAFAIGPVGNIAFAIGPVGDTGRQNGTPNGPKLSRVRTRCLPVQGSKSSKAKAPCQPAIVFTLSQKAFVKFVIKTSTGQKVGTFSRLVPKGKNVVIVPKKITRAMVSGTYRIALRAHLGKESGSAMITSLRI